MEFEDKLAHFEDELPKLMEATTILKLAFWKMRINEYSSQQKKAGCRKKIMTEGTRIQQEYRVTCGANVIIGHVLILHCTIFRDNGWEDNNGGNIDQTDVN